MVGYTKDLVRELWYQNAQARGYMLSGDSRYLQALKDSKQRQESTFEAVDKKQLSEKLRGEFDLLKKIIKEFESSLDQAVSLRMTTGMESANKYLNSIGDKLTSLETITNNFVRLIDDEMDADVRRSEETIQDLQRVMLITDAVLFIGAIAALLALTRRISRPLAAVVDAADRIAAGDFSPKAIQYRSKDEIGNLITSFAAMNMNLRELIGRVAATAEQVASASQQLTAGAEQSSAAALQMADTVTVVTDGAVSQADTVNHMTGVVRDMAAFTRQIAMAANSISEKSNETAQAAETGGEAVTEASLQMQAIRVSVDQSAEVVKGLGASSKQIGEIVEVIGNIAGQTNLLALNAAIEAARAGEQGRGFAVVADEVRKLAEQSQEAARKIALIVRGIQNETENAIQAMNRGTVEVVRGTEVITSTGEQFGHIVRLVTGLHDQIQEIGAATEELSSSSNEVAASVDSVKVLTAKTADDTQDISAAVEEQSETMREIMVSSQALARMAEDLQFAIAKFKF